MPTRTKSPYRIHAAQALLLVLLVLGTFFRVIHLDRKLYWHDEVYTSIRTLGYTGRDVTAALFTGNLLNRDDLLRYQQPDPLRGWSDTLHALSTHPEHPPLYYLLLRGWVNWFGTSIAAIRSLSVVFSLLCFPALYWLCQELFSQRVWPAAIALWAVSPIQVLYAQEARPYSLWTLLTLVSSAALLHALRRGTWRSWLGYSLAIAAAFYTALLSAVVWFCHGLYLLLLRQWRALGQWGLGTALAGTLFLPWLGVMWANWEQMEKHTEWMTYRSQLALPKLWGLHVSSAIIDPGLPPDSDSLYPLSAAVLALLIWAMVTLCRRTPIRTWLLIGLLIVMPFAALIVPDMLFGGRRSGITRYVLPSLAIAQIAVAHLLTSRWQRSPRWLAQGLTVLLLTAGIASCTVSAQAKMWWTKTVGIGNAEAIAVLRQMDRPIIISQMSGTALGDVMSLAHGLQPSVQFQLLPYGGRPPAIPRDERDRVLFHSRSLADALVALGVRVETVPSASTLLRITASDGR